jgi:hypothetical protein
VTAHHANVPHTYDKERVPMDLTVLAYLIYLGVSVLLTVWVAHVLVKAGRVFLGAVFPGDETMAQAVNQLLVVGFYLVDLGFIALWMRKTGSVATTRGIFSALSVEIGTVLLVLGVMHLGNVFVLNRLRRRAIDGPREPRPPRASNPQWPYPTTAR